MQRAKLDQQHANAELKKEKQQILEISLQPYRVSLGQVSENSKELKAYYSSNLSLENSKATVSALAEKLAATKFAEANELHAILQYDKWTPKLVMEYFVHCGIPAPFAPMIRACFAQEERSLELTSFLQEEANKKVEQEARADAAAKATTFVEFSKPEEKPQAPLPETLKRKRQESKTKTDKKPKKKSRTRK